MPLQLRKLRALEILDSRGNPTISVAAELSDGTVATAHVPSGASTGTHEVLELRDGDPTRYDGKGVRRAVANVEQRISPALAGMSADDVPSLDRRLMELDGTENKSNLGANAILGVSCAVARAVALSRNVPLFRHLHESFPGLRTPSMPVPMVNILSGGLHAGRNIEFQDFLVIAHGFSTTADALQATVAVHRQARRLLVQRGCVLTGVADEGGWGPLLDSNEGALRVLAEAIEQAGYRPLEHFSIALDVASSHFYGDGRYELATEDRSLTSSEMIDLLAEWCSLYPVRSIEDGLFEDDWEGWRDLTVRLGGSVQLVGDDFFTTNPVRLR